MKHLAFLIGLAAIAAFVGCKNEAPKTAAPVKAPHAHTHQGHDHHEHKAADSAPAAAKSSVAPAAFDAPPPVGSKAFCPVMQHEFKVTEKTERSEYKGKHYAFCCGGCKPKFDAEPEKYIKK